MGKSRTGLGANRPRGLSVMDSRGWIILAVSSVALTAVFLLPRIPQDPSYHDFADQRTWLGLANFGDVISNIAFVVVGAFGLGRSAEARRAGLHPAYAVYCWGAIAVGIGSAQYHLHPTSGTLVWDRLPMTITFMAFFAMVIGDRISPPLGRRTLWPLVALGIGSVLYWHVTESSGVGDLRPYGVVQFLPIALIVIILYTYPARHLRSGCLWGSMALYGLAKIAEYLDRWIYDVLGAVSGHTLKHLLAGAGVLLVVTALHDPTLDEPANDH